MTTIASTFTTPHPDDETLNAWLDGELDDSQRQAIGAHLDTCAQCQDSLATLHAIKAMLADVPEPELPRSFVLTPEMVASKPEPNQSERRGILRILPVARILAVAAVIAFLVLGAAIAWGPVTTSQDFGGSNADADMVFSATGTKSPARTSEEAYPPMRAAAPGQVVDRGMAATSSTNALTEMSGSSRAASETANHTSAMRSTWIGSGAVAIIAGLLWAGLTLREHSASRRTP